MFCSLKMCCGMIVMMVDDDDCGGRCIAARKFCQLWYEVFDFHHNILDPKKREEMGKKYKGSQRAILCSHPHGIIPVQVLTNS